MVIIRQSIPINKHCVKSVRIWRYSGAYFSAFGLNTERYPVSLRIHFECGKIRTRITSNTDTFCVVKVIYKCILNSCTFCFKYGHSTVLNQHVRF